MRLSFILLFLAAAVQSFAQPVYTFSKNFTTRASYLSVDADGNFYTNNDEFGVSVFDSDGNFVDKFKGTPPQTFNAYDAISIDNNGQLYIAETSKIMVYTTSGVYVKSIPISGYATSISFDEQNNLYFTDFTSGRCSIHSSTGQFVRSFQVSRPRGVAVDKNGLIYVALDMDKVKVFSSTGTFIQDFGGNDNISRSWQIMYLNNMIYVLDRGADNIKYFSLDGELLGTVTGAGSTQSQLTDVISMFIKNGYLFVGEYQSSTVNTFTSKLGQEITFNPVASKTYGDAPFMLSATATSGLPVTYSSSDPSVISISNDIATIVGGGMVSITATQTGNTEYDATTTSIEIQVAKAPQTITFTSLPSKSVNDPSYELTAESSSGLSVSYSSSNIDVVSISGNIATIHSGGEVTITASQTGNNNYLSATAVTRLQIVNNNEQIITFSAIAERTYGDPAFDLSASSTSGLPVNFTLENNDVALLVDKKIIIIAPGSVTVTAHQPGNTHYEAAPSVQQTLVVKKKNQTVFFESIPMKNVGDVFDLNATATSELDVTFLIDNPLVAELTSQKTIKVIGAGTTVIRAKQSGNFMYEAAESLQTLEAQLLTSVEQETGRISIYPNPVTEFLIVRGESIHIDGINLVDVYGRHQVLRAEAFNNEVRIETHHLPPAVYFIRIESNSSYKVIPFVKK